MKTTQLNHTPWLVNGATMIAFGLASERPEDVLIIEQSASPAPEFAGAFFTSNGSSSVSRSPAGTELERELTERDILKNGRYHLSALVPVLMRRIVDRGIHCLFWTDITEIKPAADGGCEVSFFNASGLQQIRTARALDTTAGPSARRTAQFHEKTLIAVLHGITKSEDMTELPPEMVWRPGRFDNESYFGVKLDPATAWPEARRILMKAWRNRPKALAETLIAAIATEFHYPCAPEQSASTDGVIHLPSAGFADPLNAFEAGVALAQEARQ